MTAPRIRPAHLWEAPALARILAAHLREAAWLPPRRTRAEDLRLIARLIRKGAVRVATTRGRIAGFLVVENGEVHALYLAPKMRGRGIGRALLFEAKREAARLGLWAHAANHPARRFYTANGFRAVGFGDGNDEGLTEIRFEWERAA